MTGAGNPATAREATAWHAIAADEVIRRLDSNIGSGLDAADAEGRLQRYGPNRLPEAAKQGPFMRLLLQFNNVLVYVLLGAGFIKAMMGLWLDASVILGVVGLNALLGFVQGGRAEKALDSIRGMLSADARTVRGGETRMTPAEDLVPGDVVLLESGDRIPADLRLADVKNLRTAEAALTRGSGSPRTNGRPPWPRTRRSEIAKPWRSPARWSCPVAPPGSSWGPAATPSWAASTRCSPPSAP